MPFLIALKAKLLKTFLAFMLFAAKNAQEFLAFIWAVFAQMAILVAIATLQSRIVLLSEKSGSLRLEFVKLSIVIVGFSFGQNVSIALMRR